VKSRAKAGCVAASAAWERASTTAGGGFTAGQMPATSEGKGQKFESSRARHDFNDLAGFAKEPFIAAEAPRKHSTGSNRTVCRTPVGNELASNELRKRGAQR
jgi:hypothetical protein